MDITPVGRLVGGAVGAFLTALVVGAIVVPDYTVQKTTLLNDPVGAVRFDTVLGVYLEYVVTAFRKKDHVRTVARYALRVLASNARQWSLLRFGRRRKPVEGY